MADRDARFEQVLRETQLQLRSYIRGFGVAHHDVDDIAQEVYVEFYKKMEELPGSLEPARWLKGTARNRCLMHFRKTSSRRKALQAAVAHELAASEEQEGTEQTSQHGDLFDALRRCIQRLTARSREILKLRHEEERSANDIASALGITAAAVRKSLFLIRRSLNECLAPDLPEGRAP